MPEVRGQEWRWVEGTIVGDSNDVRSMLIVTPGPFPMSQIILECGNVDPTYKDRIAAVPDLMRLARAMADDYLDESGGHMPLDDRHPMHELCDLLDQLKG